METVQPYFEQALAWAREGYNQVNAVQGLIIAVVAAFLMGSYGRIFIISFGATLVHVVADVLLPVVANGAPLVLPPILESGYWRYVAVLFLGYFIIITVFYILKRTFLRG